MPGFADFAGFAGVVEITRLNKSEFQYYLTYLDELCGNELVFELSFVSSNNSDVETREQVILMHTKYVYDISGLASFSQKLFGFLVFDPR